MNRKTKDLFCDILEDAIKNERILPACKKKLTDSLSKDDISYLVIAIMMQFDEDDRLNVVRKRTVKHQRS